MSQQSIDYIKSRFETGDRPNGQDYADLIDTLAGQATNLGSAGNNDSVITGIENQTTVDTFNMSDWRSIKYFVAISSTANGNNKFYSTEINLLIDQNTISLNEVGSLDNDGDIGTVVVSEDAGVVSLIVTPSPDFKPVTVRFYRTGLKA